MHRPDSVQLTIMTQVRDVASAALNLLFPNRCAGCGRSGSDLCESCLASFTPVGDHVCPVCSEIHPPDRVGVCPRCARQPRAYRKIASAFRYEGQIRRAIHALKYSRKSSLAFPLAESLGAALPRPSADLVLCAVPLHPQREAERGFNQSYLLAEQLASRWNLPMLPKAALVRLRATERQVGQDYGARQANMVDAFGADRDLVAGRAVLLVDDVCTTGSTLHASAQALISAGAQVVDGVTLARAVGVGQLADVRY